MEENEGWSECSNPGCTYASISTSGFCSEKCKDITYLEDYRHTMSQEAYDAELKKLLGY